MERDINKELTDIINEHDVVLFMKGSPLQPACGFSSRAISILKINGLSLNDFKSVNVLEDDLIRNGIKEFSQWPTIPQLYIKQEFVGGSDIMMELHDQGELKTLLDSVIRK